MYGIRLVNPDCTYSRLVSGACSCFKLRSSKAAFVYGWIQGVFVDELRLCMHMMVGGGGFGVGTVDLLTLGRVMVRGQWTPWASLA